MLIGFLLVGFSSRRRELDLGKSKIQTHSPQSRCGSSYCWIRHSHFLQQGIVQIYTLNILHFVLHLLEVKIWTVFLKILKAASYAGREGRFLIID